MFRGLGDIMQRYFIDIYKDNKFELSKDDIFHITKVMRMKKDDKNELYITKIISLEPFEIEIIEKKDTYNELDIKVTICQSLVKENKMDLVLEKSTELGAYEFIPLITRNSIIKLDKKEKEKKVIRWQKIVKEASEQSKRNIIPKVLEIKEIEDISNMDYDLKILLSVNEVSTSLKNVLQNHRKCDKMIIVIGPEGGFKDCEEKYLIEHGFIRTSLGNRVLRTETASITALSMINYEYER